MMKRGLFRLVSLVLCLMFLTTGFSCAEDTDTNPDIDPALLHLFDAYNGTDGTESNAALIENAEQAQIRKTVFVWEEQSGLPILRAGKAYYIAVAANGTMFAWGDNGYGQLGTSFGVSKSVSSPVRVELPFDGTEIRDVRCGDSHTLVLTGDGRVWSAGNNGNGQLGRGEKGKHGSSFAQVEGLPEIRAIACGADFCMALDREGHVWTWGYNSKGQLGIGNTRPTITPTQVPGLNDITAIAAGEDFSLALNAGLGILYSWGDNSRGQQLKLSHWGKSSSPQVLSEQCIAAIAAGSNSTYALDINGRLWVWGDNDKYQLGVKAAKTKTNNVFELELPEDIQVRRLEVYDKTVVILSTRGRAVIMGSTGSGQLGDNTHPWHKLYAELPVEFISLAAAASESVALMTADGTVLVAGASEKGQLGISNYYRKLMQRYTANGLNLMTGEWKDPGTGK